LIREIRGVFAGRLEPEDQPYRRLCHVCSVSRDETYRASIEVIHFEVRVVVVKSTILQAESEVVRQFVIYSAAVQECGLVLRLSVYIDLQTIRDIVRKIGKVHPCTARIKAKHSGSY
jgi:hypothetical protein